MDFSPFLDVAISVVFVYLLLSVMVSTTNEMIQHMLQQRGKALKSSIEEVFNDFKLNKNYAELMYAHPLIDRMKKTANHLPSYISSDVFSKTLIDVIGQQQRNSNFAMKQNPVTKKYEEVILLDNLNAFDEFKAAVNKMQHSDIKIMLLTLLNHSNDLDSLKKNIEIWFNDYMDRVGGWYKAKMQWFLYGISAAVALAFNVDTIHLTQELWKNKILSKSVADAASKYYEKEMAAVNINNDSTAKAKLDKIKQTTSEINALKLPIGWADIRKDNKQTTSIITANHFNWTTPIGWIITALAISFGAPFWFDLLGKLVNIRKSGVVPKTDIQK